MRSGMREKTEEGCLTRLTGPTRQTNFRPFSKALHLIFRIPYPGSLKMISGLIGQRSEIDKETHHEQDHEDH